MTREEFNKKWEKHIPEGHYGMDLNLPLAISYLNDEIEKEVLHNPEFELYQVKIKWNICSVYSSSNKDSKWAQNIDTFYAKEE